MSYEFDYLTFDNSGASPKLCTANHFGDFCDKLNKFFYEDPARIADCSQHKKSPWGNKIEFDVDNDKYLILTKDCDEGKTLNERMQDRFVMLKCSNTNRDLYERIRGEDVPEIMHACCAIMLIYAEHWRETVAAALSEASAMHPYRVPGNRDSYSQYSEGWTDALNYIESRVNNMALF